MAVGEQRIYSPRMNLNGWQRLFVVVAVLWSMLVVAVAMFDWPSESHLTRAEVFAHLDPTVGGRIDGYQSPNGFIPDIPIPAPEKVAINVAGHDLDVTADPKDRDASLLAIAGAYAAAMRETLRARRMNYAGLSAAVALVPMVMLYALGYSVAWVRRGFASLHSGSPVP